MTTYGSIAAMLGDARAGREVGVAMSRAPEAMKLPCHRVISKDGSMAPGSIFGGAENQRQMLEGEGVRFFADGRVDMAKHLWPVREEERHAEQFSLF